MVAENTQMRVLALLNQSLDELDARKAKGKGDFVAKLAGQMLEDPQAAVRAMLDWLAKVAPPEAVAAAGAGMTLDIKALYLNAIQTANGHAPPALPGGTVIEHDEGEGRGTIGVHDNTTDW